jgi:TonB-linked SusC/RagA family outer membrane protein
MLGECVYAQNIQVSGTVKDASDGSVLPGVAVVLKGQTSRNAVTNINGQYTINVPADGVLIFQYMGMKNKEVQVGGRKTLDVLLENDAVALSEVVVTSGYGVNQKGTFTGSAASVKKDKLEIPVSSFDKALQGNAAGVLSVSNSGQPGAGQSVTIRGIGSINASTAPLYIVDGVPVATGNYGNMTQTIATASADNLNALASLNSNDIESLVVLKDASATSIYGARASNGVILITTKRGAQGRTQVNLKLTQGFSSRTTKSFTTLTKDDYIQYITDARVNAGYSAATTDVNGKAINSFIANTFPVRNSNKDFYDFDWFKYAYNDNAPTQTVDLGIRGGDAKTKFYTSFSYLDQEGIVTKTGLTRYTGRLNLDHNIAKNLKYGVNLSMSYSEQESPMTTSGYYVNPVFGALMYAPIDPGMIDPGSYLYSSSTGTFTPYEPQNGVNIDNMVTYANANFIANQMYDDFISRTAKTTSNMTAQWDITDNLVLKAHGGIDYFFLTEKEWRDPRCKGNSASYLRGTSETSVTEEFIWNQNVTLNYIKSFGKHNVNIMVAQENQGEKINNVDAIKQDFPGTDFHEMSQGATNYGTYGSHSGTALASFFAKGDYNYYNKYFLSALIRRDGSSKLAQKWSNFWSLGASWRISSEKFAQNWEWLTSATLRTSYGTAGNSSGIGKYAAMGLYGGGANYNGNAGTYPSQISNPDLKWEKSESFNLGLDFSFFKSRLGGTIELYNRDTKDLLLDMPLSLTSGFASITSNIGSMNNRGIELSLNAVPVVTKNLKWTVDFNITSNKNKVTKLVTDAPIISSPWIYTVGKDFQTFYTRPWAGVNPADGRAMYYDLDGNIIYDITQSGDNRKYCGSAAPKFYGGLSTRLDAYGFDLSMSFYFTYGNKIYDSSWLTATGAGYSGLRNQHSSMATDRWRQEGDIAQYPKAYYGYAASVYGGYGMDKIIFDGSYIRLRDLTLGYTIPEKWTKVVNISSVRLYAQGTNLLTLTTFPDADPEVGRSGYYYLGYPNAKTITFGLDIKF